MNPFAYNLVAAAILCALVMAAIVGILDTATRTGPNCPAPVPAEWLGFCAEYDGQ